MTTTKATRRIDIEFLYIDLSTCDRCRGTDESLGAALETLRSVLGSAGIAVNLRKVLIDSDEKAREHRLLASPTIRVNGRDVALAVKESRCGACSDVAGEGTDCRVWEYEGKEFTEAPQALLVDAILKAAYAPEQKAAAPETPYPGVPANLSRFFEAKASRAGGPCCPPSSGASCCA